MSTTKTDVWCTSYCNRGHRLHDGKPVEHECYILPPKALELERAGDTRAAIDAIEAAKPLRAMRRGVRAAKPEPAPKPWRLRVLVITLGLGGHTGYCASERTPHGKSKSTIQGYHGDPERCATDMAERYDVEGAWMIDMRAALRANPMLSLRGPLLDVDLEKPEDFDSQAAVESLMGQGLLAMGGAFGNMLAGAHAGVVNLGQVGIEDYLSYWRNGGARIGRICGGVITWENANGT